MYVTIDRESMRFLRKHPDPFLLADLADIESPHIGLSVEPCDTHTFLRGFTDMEVKMLYRNTTGQENKFFGDGLRAVLMELVQRMEEFEGNREEIAAQAAWLPAGNTVPHSYVKGAKRPVKRPDLFDQPALTATPVENEVKIAALNRQAASTLYPGAAEYRPAQAEQPAAEATVPTKRAPAPQRPSNAPRTGGVRERIWAVADSMWEAAGKPTEKTAVLAFRKNVMSELEEKHAVKRTSSSNELGNWQKARIV